MRSVGEKFLSLGEDRFNKKVICQHLREDFKKAFDKNFKFSVGKDRYAITVKIQKMPKYLIKSEFVERDNFSWLNPRIVLAEEFWKTIEYIGNQYNYDNSEIMADYFDCNYYFHLEFGENVQVN